MFTIVYYHSKVWGW